MRKKITWSHQNLHCVKELSNPFVFDSLPSVMVLESLTESGFWLRPVVAGNVLGLDGIRLELIIESSFVRHGVD